MPDTIGGVAGADPAAGMHGSVDSAMSALGGLDSDGFLQLLMAQLQYQNPLEPSDPSTMMNQTAALAQLDATQQLLSAQQQGLGLQQAVAAAGMLGNEVTATREDGTPVTGIVDAIRYGEAGPVLEVGGEDVAFRDVSEIRDVVEPSATADTGS